MAAAFVPKANHRLVLHERPARGPVTDTTFRSEHVPIGELEEGEVLVRVEYTAIEATMRNWLNAARSYIEPIEIGAVMRALGIGHVVASKAPNLQAGDLVYGTLGWQTYYKGPAGDLRARKTPLGGNDFDHLGLYGISGMTAYFGMFDVGRLRDGDKVVVSGAAGSVGLIATQIALAHPKCTVAAIAGSEAKCEKLRKMGCHAVFNYKDKDFHKQLRKFGLVDVYFDNVGGEILDHMLAQIKPYARIVACGAISSYSAKEQYGIKNLATLISMKARMEGFIAMDYQKRYGEAMAYLADLAVKGKMEYEYTILKARPGDEDGLARCVEGMDVVSSGRNVGKTLVQMQKDDAKAKL